MRRERVVALVALLGLALALHLGAAAEAPLEIALGLVALGLVTVTASRRFATWLDRPRPGSIALRTLLVLGPTLAAAALYLGGPSAWDDLGLRGDWPVNEAFVHAIRDALARGESLEWSTRIAPGDPTTDLYPTVGHTVLARLSLWLGEDVSIHRIVVGAAALAFVSVALGVARAARATGAPWSACALVGLACLYDYGSDFGWGARATWFWGFFPSTLALGVWYAMLPSALEVLRRPRPSRLAFVAAGLGVAALMHPVGLVLSGALFVAVIVGVPAVRAPDRSRVLSMGVALALGVALTAPGWAPASQRVLDHGVHFGTPTVPVEIALGRMASGQLPDGSYPVLVLLGWLGGCRALALRRAGGAVVALAALFLVSLYMETYFLDLGLAPSITSVRWQSFRVGTFLKPMLYVLSAHGLGVGASFLAATASRRVRGATRVLALLGVCAVWWIAEPDVAVWLEGQQVARRIDMTGPYLADREAFAELRAHLAAERARIPAEQHARLLIYCPLDCPYELMTLAWDPGISLLMHHPAPAGHFLRDQFFEASPENLRRFGVRWALAVQRTPPPGDTATERRFGDLILRENPSWDGTFAHVAGEGAPSADLRVRVETVEGRGYDVVVDGGPARVELGTPYYPRLRAFHDGTEIPVEPLPVRASPPDAVDRGERAVALDLPPGRTQLRARGALASDDRGLVLFLLASIVVGLLIAARVHRGARSERWLARGRRWLASPRPGQVGLALAVLVLVLVPLGDASARGLRFGVLFGAPRMHLEPRGDEPPVPCEARSFGRRYECGEVEVNMTVATVIQDWHVGWPVPVPSIEVRGAPYGSTLVMETRAPLVGDYLGGCDSCSGEIERGGVTHPFGPSTSRVALPPGAGATVRIHVRGSIARAALVRADLVEPPPSTTIPPS